MDRKYPLSVHAGIVDKPDEAGRRRSGRGWDAVELSKTEIVEAIREGWAMAPQYRGGHRKTGNFIGVGFLAADVDAGMTLDEANDHPFVRHHAGLVHTTVSHTAERHRLRIIFLLDEPIQSARDWADAQLGIALKFNSDASVSDGARMFFGNTKAAIYHIGRTLPAAVVAGLIARGRDARAARKPGGGVLPVVSVRQIAGPELVKIAGGDMVRLDELGVGTRVHCPHHDDTDPSAFAVMSRTRQIGLRCSACRVTFWSSDEQDGYDFGAFDRLFEQRFAGQHEVDPEATGLDRFFPPAPRFERQQERFLPPVAYEPGITLVKSPKGSGKTEALLSMIRAIRAGQFRGDILHGERPKSILLIGHRQSLLREAARKLGLRCYLDDEEEPDGAIRTLAVTLDSLPKYNESGGELAASKRRAFDLVIIDESEQVLGHLFGETISKNRGVERCFDALNFEVANAKAVIALDADLGLVTAHALRTMRPQDWASRCRIVYNAPVTPENRRVMKLHKSRPFLESQVIDAIKRGERCFVTSNSKRFIDTLHRMIVNECGDGIVIRVITSDNSRDEAIVRFLAEIKTKILLVQAVLGTPSIGTGIDITFPDGECRVDRVFGFFYPFVNTHTDIDQQLARVRNPGAIDVWISPATFNFTCHPDIIKDDLARAYVVKRAVIGRREDGMVEYNHDDPLLMICAHVTALQRASKNRLVELFCALREANGWSIEWVSDKASAIPHQLARDALDAERLEALLSAPTIGDADFMDLDIKVSKGIALTREERVTYERNHFERVVGVPLDEALVGMNADGKLLDRVGNFARIIMIWSQDRSDGLVDILLAPTEKPKGRLQGTKPEILTAVLMRAAGLTTVDGLKTTELISDDMLHRFVGICRDNRTVIEEILGEPFRSDFEKKPMRQLNMFLKRVGLKLSVANIEKVAGRKIRYYGIPSDPLGTMTHLARSYLAIEPQREAAKKEAWVQARKRSRNAPLEMHAPPPAETETGLLSSSILSDRDRTPEQGTIDSSHL
ncbi:MULTISPECIES: plasmid replication protein, CyRepA1 family [unclassified Bradyrhizobium]|uniref:plasmid replication protein, CyRepA1 family n=1 Tax=unclassified Bradyrhizobium TaxID=2631580 RepID=UPI00143DEA24|nr:MULTISPECIES: plasmid replication protein, CyRepA1 family [unclassified Bradyrhizobium]